MRRFTQTSNWDKGRRDVEGSAAPYDHRVSVVIPAFNAARYLAATLQSVADQHLAAGEVIVVDDGSTDATREIATSFGATVIAGANAGPSAARNAGTRAARYPFVAFLDADDLWAPEKLALQSAALRAFGEPAFSFTDFRAFDERGFHRRRTELRFHPAFRKHRKNLFKTPNVVVVRCGARPVMFDDNFIQPSTAVVRVADVLAVGGFDETLRTSEDFEFFLRLFARIPALAVMQPLMHYRRHAGQATADGTRMKASLIEVGARVARAPDRYPAQDVRYLAATTHTREYRLGLQQARLGDFASAGASLERSLEVRPTLCARIALAGTQVCRSRTGRTAFHAARTLWKRRPGKR